MSTALFDVILLWTPEQSNADYTELRKLLDVEYVNQFRIHAFTNTQEAISAVKSKTKSSQPLIVITKLGTTQENLGQPLIEDIRQREKQTFIILHSHTACVDPNLR
jgi:Cft2 family RNA processing exonuclease